MILARISKAVREQNWFAVAIEFVIVIAGVVIGFQVNEFATAARAHAEAERALARLRLESEAVVDFWAENVSDATGRDAERLVLLRTIADGEAPADEDEAIYNALERLYFYPSMNPPRTAFDELMESGGLSLISDPDARQAVSEYADSSSFIGGQLDQFRLSVPRGMETLERHLHSVYDPSDPTLRRIEYDISGIVADREVVSSVVDGARNQRVFLFFRMGVLRHALDMCEALSAAEGVPCETSEAGRAVLDAARAHLRENTEEPT